MSHEEHDHFQNPSRLFIWTHLLASKVFFRSYYNELIRHLHLQGNEIVLDFGCGLGVLGGKIADKVRDSGSVTCLDVSPAMIDQSKKRLRGKKNVSLHLGDIRDVQFPKETFDYIVSTWAIHHIPKDILEESISKLVTSLKPGGSIFVIEFPNSQQEQHQDHSLKEEDLIDVFTKFGFNHEILFQKKHGVLFKFYLVVTDNQYITEHFSQESEISLDSSA